MYVPNVIHLSAGNPHRWQRPQKLMFLIQNGGVSAYKRQVLDSQLSPYQLQCRRLSDWKVEGVTIKVSKLSTDTRPSPRSCTASTSNSRLNPRVQNPSVWRTNCVKHDLDFLTHVTARKGGWEESHQSANSCGLCGGFLLFHVELHIQFLVHSKSVRRVRPQAFSLQKQ